MGKHSDYRKENLCIEWEIGDNIVSMKHKKFSNNSIKGMRYWRKIFNDAWKSKNSQRNDSESFIRRKK